MLRKSSNRRHNKKRTAQNKKNHEETGKRRVRTPWLDYEIQNLIIGVYNFGIGKWAIIHSHMSFQKNRTYIDLKDKWRNLVDRRQSARTSAVYRSIASSLQKEQIRHGHTEPDKLLTKNDWNVLLKKYSIEPDSENYSQPSEPIDYSYESETTETTESSTQSTEEEESLEPTEEQVNEVKSNNLNSLLNSPVINLKTDANKYVQPIPVKRNKIPSLQDFLW